VALLAGLTWIQELVLQQYPNHTGTNPLVPLLIPIDNNSVVKDVHRIINAHQTPTTYDLLNPDFEIMQAIRTKLIELPIRTDVAHFTSTKRHQGQTKLCYELDLHAKINMLAKTS
jgi:hypothetical protein